MTKYLLLLLLPLCGCSSVSKLQAFLDQLPPTDIAKAESQFSSPLWSSDILVTGIETDADGLLDVKSASADVKIPLWGVVSKTTLSDFKQIPTAKERAQAAADAAAKKAAKAEATAAKARAKAATAEIAARGTP